MPRVATTATAGYRAYVPTSTRNSLMKLDRPGRASEDRPAIMKQPASSGVLRWRPP